MQRRHQPFGRASRIQLPDRPRRRPTHLRRLVDSTRRQPARQPPFSPRSAPSAHAAVSRTARVLDRRAAPTSARRRNRAPESRRAPTQPSREPTSLLSPRIARAQVPPPATRAPCSSERPRRRRAAPSGFSSSLQHAQQHLDVVGGLEMPERDDGRAAHFRQTRRDERGDVRRGPPVADAAERPRRVRSHGRRRVAQRRGRSRPPPLFSPSKPSARAAPARSCARLTAELLRQLRNERAIARSADERSRHDAARRRSSEPSASSSACDSARSSDVRRMSRTS